VVHPATRNTQTVSPRRSRSLTAVLEPAAEVLVTLEVKLFGRPEFSVDGAAINPPTRKGVAILAYLALEGRTSRARLASLLWADHNEEDARHNLRQELYRLSTTPVGPYLITASDEVRLQAQVLIDVAQFRAALESQDERAALGLYRGRFLADFEVRNLNPELEEWLESNRDALAESRRVALNRLATKLEANGDWREALNAHLELIREDELRERHHRQAMHLHQLLGEREQALERFERLKMVLAKELGLEPLPETRLLAERIRQAEPLSVAPGVGPRLEPPLIGREESLVTLERAWSAGQVILVYGDPGVGKSRLVSTFTSNQGHVEIHEGRPTDSDVPYATLARVLRRMLHEWQQETPDLEPTGITRTLPSWIRSELSRLVPEFEPDGQPTVEGSKQRLFDAFTVFLDQHIARKGLQTLVCEDLHFFDPSSLEISLYLARHLLERQQRGERVPRLIATCWRGHLPVGSQRAIDDLKRLRMLTILDLEPLTETNTLAVVRALSGSAGAVRFARRLHNATNGNPFFLLETIRALFDTGELGLGAGGWVTRYDQDTLDYTELPIPKSVFETVIRRADLLSPAARRLLEAASLASSPFQLDDLDGATALSDWEAIDALEAATRARFLEAFEGGHRFTHSLIQRAVLEGLSAERKQLLHRKLARTLEQQRGTPVRIAEHLERGGSRFEAATWYLRAAEDAEQIFGHHEAFGHYEKALRNGVDPVLEPEIKIRFEDLRQKLEARSDEHRTGEHQTEEHQGEK
jgi:DNA-binding SARP family transcriptional activator